MDTQQTTTQTIDRTQWLTDLVIAVADLATDKPSRMTAVTDAVFAPLGADRARELLRFFVDTRGLPERRHAAIAGIVRELTDAGL